MEPTDPFDRHPGRPESLEHRADTLLRLAAEATDHEALTTKSHDQAVASWDGMAAAELRAAPVEVRHNAQDVASRVAWAALPFLTWAGHIRDFNRKVDGLLDRYGEVPVIVERELVAEFGEELYEKPEPLVDEFRLQRRHTKIEELKLEWRDAFGIHMDEGKREVVSMLRHGPTWGALEAARERGLLPESAMGQFFVAGWDRSAALDEAERVGDIILAGRGDQVSVEELERLGEILERYGDDHEFSYILMLGLGQEDLLHLNAAVAVLAGEDSDPRRQAAVGVVQAGLATALATATTRRGTGGTSDFDPYQPAEFELGSDWVLALAAAGRELIEVSHPTAPSYIYGYQALGVLLSNGGYDDAFLRIIGSDMIDFEISQGGSGFWAEDSRLHVEGVRLNWLHGAGFDQPAGYDPMIGLLEALAESPEGMRDVLTGRGRLEQVPLYPGDPDSPLMEVHRLPRLKYLLTDRVWPPDVVDNPAYAHLEFNGPRPGVVALGHALEGATRVDPDDAAYRIVEAIIFETAVHEQVEGLPDGYPDAGWHGTFSETDLIHPELRQSLANITNDYIQDVHWALSETGRVPSSDVPYEQRLDLNKVNDRHLAVFLADLGKDGGAAATVAAAQYHYAAEVLDHYLEGWDIGAEPSGVLSGVLGPVAEVIAALDVGATSQLRSDLAAGDAEHNDALRHRFFWGEAATSGVTNAPVAGAAGHGVLTVLEQWEESLQQDSTGTADFYHGNLKQMSRQTLADMLSAAAYDHVTNELSAPEFLGRFNEADLELAQLLVYPDDHPEAGAFVPMTEWEPDHFDAWAKFYTAEGNRGIHDLFRKASNEYDLTFLSSRDDLGAGG